MALPQSVRCQQIRGADGHPCDRRGVVLQGREEALVQPPNRVGLSADATLRLAAPDADAVAARRSRRPRSGRTGARGRTICHEKVPGRILVSEEHGRDGLPLLHCEGPLRSETPGAGDAEGTLQTRDVVNVHRVLTGEGEPPDADGIALPQRSECHHRRLLQRYLHLGDRKVLHVHTQHVAVPHLLVPYAAAHAAAEQRQHGTSRPARAAPVSAIRGAGGEEPAPWPGG
mmetsp:Transcript_70326/g.209620  ORF Transcript_70326/g.209620 Transcript_70326/m.209620 type:complete len:229 (-) Transcript_70326:4-690(-)